MVQDELELVDLALQSRLVTRRQAEMIREELSLFPGEKAGHLMLRRHYLTEDQLNELRGMVQGGGQGDGSRAPDQQGGDAPTPAKAIAPSADIAPAAHGPPDETPAGGAVKPQLSVAQLRAGQPLPPNMRDARAAAAAAARDGGSQQPTNHDAEPASPVQPAPVVQPTPPQPAVPKTLVGLLRLTRHWGASDLHLSAGRPPFVRLNGEIRYLETEPLSAERAQELNFSALTDEQRALALEHQQIDFALEIPNVGRHRCNVFKQRLGWDGSFRIVRATVPTLAELGLPDSLRQFTEYHQGLVMVTGAGGSGKTTTVAALLDVVNQNRRDHIITVEDPVEYVLAPKNCQITQREVGLHTMSFANALRAALREDPDIIFVGELRDLETTSIAISAAETGHLVFSTMHTSSAARTVSRIVDVYPVNQQAQVCTMVAESLRGVISQALLPRRDGGGSVMALEVLANTSGVAQQIKEGKTHMITSLIQSGKKYGMILLDDSLQNLHRQGLITGRDAYRRANNKALFDAVKDDV